MRKEVTKRKSGWYRVFVGAYHRPAILYYDSRCQVWEINGNWDALPDEWQVDPQMVMTSSGELVYNKTVYDPLGSRIDRILKQ